MQNFSLSFIIPVLNGEKFIGDCLSYMSKEMAPQDEVIVVDNGSTDRTIEIAESFDRVRVIHHPKITIAAMRNRGSEIARGNVLAFIDCDCLICPGWRKAAEETLADDSVHATGSHFDLSLTPTWIEKAWIPPRKNLPEKTHYIPSGNLVVRKDVYDEIGGFDESLVTDEDTEIGHRLNRLGHTIVDAPGVRVMHQGNAKTVAQFTKKEKWHATSILKTFSAQALDKPMVMTIVFLFGALLTLVSLAASFFIPVPVWPFVAIVILVPILTALYRAYTYGEYRYIPQLVVLFLIFYVVRSQIVLSALPRLLGGGPKVSGAQR